MSYLERPVDAKLVGRCSECGAEAWAWKDHPATLRHAPGCSQVVWFEKTTDEVEE